MTSLYSSSSSYYDIDAILAEEELVPINNRFDFSHLAHLDPDYVHPKSPTSIMSPSASYSQQDNDDDDGSSKKYFADEDNLGGVDGDTSISTSRTKSDRRRKRQLRNTSKGSQQQQQQQHHTLPENTRVKMPLWSILKWCELGFIDFNLPKHFGRRGREKLDVDPVSVNLRKKNERFYLSGMALVDLIHACVEQYHGSIGGRNSNNNNNPQTSIMNKLHDEGQELKRTLLLTYTGSRLRRTFDWTLSHIDDDVSHFTEKLTEMERRLFECGAAASHAFAMWKLFGSRKIQVSQTALRANIMSVTTESNTNSHGGGRNGEGEDDNNGGRRDGGSKRGLLSKRSISYNTTSSRFVAPDFNMTRKRVRSY
mmetsp:Transcript_9191/g.11509  ORF Transcript_9191/g.11509 Transcript_9191/m.11509 type:complete len:367 (+) Transcript_9191:299-1399(+)